MPLCNLAGNALSTAADIVFARTLHAGNHLLWAEDPDLPDVAPGRQQRDSAFEVAPDPIVIDSPCASGSPLDSQLLNADIPLGPIVLVRSFPSLHFLPVSG